MQKKPRFGVVIFPGSNCDMDTLHAVKEVCGYPCEFIFYKQKSIEKYDCIILPGGFSFGDYLRVGALARFTPVMEKIIKYARKGKLVIGICNGFQILLEAGLLPGAMLINRSINFISRKVFLKVENSNSVFTNLYKKGEIIRMPIAHYMGNYFIEKRRFFELKKNSQIIFTYSDENGNVNDRVNPNGALGNIAGIVNKRGNVLGMMPHFERACENILGSEDGRTLVASVVKYLTG